MAFGVTIDGFVVKDLQTIRQEIDDAQRDSIDPGLTLTDRDPLGQVNAVISGALAEIWEVAGAVYSSQYPNSASGSSLDEVSSITNTVRSAQSKTLVTGEVQLNPNKSLPAGSVANLQGQPNARFITLALVPATINGGTFTVDFEAESAGFLAVVPNQLTEIAVAVSGWVGVDNIAGATFSGSDIETDSELRVKRNVELTACGSTSVDAIRADLTKLAGVTDASVLEDLVTHTIRCILRGGTAVDIGQQIFDSKAAGIGTTGVQLELVADSQAIDHEIRFDFATQENFFAIVVVEVDPLVFDDTNGPTNIKDSIAAYVNSLGVGADVIFGRVTCAIFEVAGVSRIATLLIGFDVADQVIDLIVAPDEVANSDVANISVTVA